MHYCSLGNINRIFNMSSILLHAHLYTISIQTLKESLISIALTMTSSICQCFLLKSSLYISLTCLTFASLWSTTVLLHTHHFIKQLFFAHTVWMYLHSYHAIHGYLPIKSHLSDSLTIHESQVLSTETFGHTSSIELMARNLSNESTICHANS